MRYEHAHVRGEKMRTLDTMISVANWLYINSPAKYITPLYNSILVYGDGIEADILYEMLFSTAFKPGTHINLVRVTNDAEKKEEAFLERNIEGIQYFSQNLLSNINEKKPMTIHFFEISSNWKELFSFAYAYAPTDILDSCHSDSLFQFDCIPALHSIGESWNVADEGRVPVLKVTRKVHTAYIAGWNSSYREQDIDRDLYGKLTEDDYDDYILRSSMRLAISIPWKLEIANAHTPEELMNRINDQQDLLNGHTIRDYLSWAEHRSWQAFMILNGWHMPTLEEMKTYMFVGKNDHRNKDDKLHPCLCDLEDDWFDTHNKSLKDIRHSAWSEAYRSSLQDFSKLDRISLEIHHRCKEIVASDEYAQIMNERFSELEDAVISDLSPDIDILFQRLRFLENMFSRLRNNEANSYNPFQSSCNTFISAVRESAGESSGIEKSFSAMLKDAQVAINRNKYCDYKVIDEEIIDWLPWIIDNSENRVIWKLYSYDNPIENIISTLMIRPSVLILVYNQRAIPNEQVLVYHEMLTQHGMEDVVISQVSASAFENGCIPIRSDEKQKSIIDVTGAGDFQHRIELPADVRVVYYDGVKLSDKMGYPFCAELYKQNISITVDEVLKLKGQMVKSAESNNETLGMEEDFVQLWDVCHNLKATGYLKPTIEALNKAESKLRSSVFTKRGTESNHLVFNITRKAYRQLLISGCIRTLFDLQTLRAISSLTFENKASTIQITMDIFPDENDEDKYQKSESTIKAILSPTKENSSYVIDDEYISATGPVQVVDLSRPIVIDSMLPREKAGITKLQTSGLLSQSEQRGEYRYKTLAVRHGLKKEGFPLEAYVYYTLFLSGAFDDVRSNVTVVTGQTNTGTDLQKEMDVLVTSNGKLGIISCKDTPYVKIEHIVELVQQIREYGISAKAILVCSENERLDDQIIKACEMLQVTIIGIKDLQNNSGSKRRLVNNILYAVQR